MIGHKVIVLKELVRILHSAINRYCVMNNLPRITVSYGSVSGKGGLAFIYRPVPKIILHRNLSIYLLKHSDYGKVWYVLQAVGHEVTHYKQYIRQKLLNVPLSQMRFPENEAYLAGHQFADNNIKHYSLEEINPFITDLGANTLAGVGLGIGFKAVDLAAKKMRK